MDAIDSHAAEVLQDEIADTEPALELDTAIDLDGGEDGAGADDTSAAIADPLELPPAPASLPAAIDLPLELDLDIESESTTAAQPLAQDAAAEYDLPPAPAEAELMLDLEPEPALEAELEPEPEPLAAQSSAALADHWPPAAPQAAPAPEALPDPALEEQLAIETMSDAELEAALAAELAVMERSIGAPADNADISERIEPSFDAPQDAEPALNLPARAAPDLHALDDDDDALVELSSASKQAARNGASALPDAETDLLLQPARTTEAAADADQAAGEEPGFIKRDRRRQKYGKAISVAMALGSVALVGTLGAQGVTTFRNQLAAAMPPLKPALTAACNALGCKIELPAQIDDLNIEQGELQTLSDTTFSFNTLLRNQSATAQSWPHIELVLDDASDKAVLRRVFSPRDYLGPDVPLDKGFAPHTEQAVKLFFELNQLKASGYHIAVFYP
ncbi:DUF3426 domain-containing protein [Pseudoduganella sp. CY13W]|uniref:DUF3426 domain-containing protein n=2 Tax=Duganella qianjiadongensis TaxID=2692176 RepID=A0ABW9VL46_9BURK|nr:DUF3426 domain-containing protein [Duganella qianjiadongensis]